MARQASRRITAGRPRRRRVEGRVADAIVVRKAGEEDARETTLAEVAGETGLRGSVVFEKGGVGVDLAAEPFAQDQLGSAELKGGVEFRASTPLNAMVRPKGLRAIGKFDLLEGLFAGVGRGEGVVVGGVPVLREDDVLETRRDGMDDRNDGVAVGNGKRTAGAEIILHVDDDENVL